jgi:hypothetical protein
VREQLPQLPAQSALSSAFTVKNAFRKLGLPAQSDLLSAFTVKNAFRKLGFGLGPDLMIIGILNSSIVLKIEF